MPAPPQLPLPTSPPAARPFLAHGAKAACALLLLHRLLGFLAWAYVREVLPSTAAEAADAPRGRRALLRFQRAELERRVELLFALTDLAAGGGVATGGRRGAGAGGGGVGPGGGCEWMDADAALAVAESAAALTRAWAT